MSLTRIENKSKFLISSQSIEIKLENKITIRSSSGLNKISYLLYTLQFSSVIFRLFISDNICHTRVLKNIPSSVITIIIKNPPIQITPDYCVRVLLSLFSASLGKRKYIYFVKFIEIQFIAPGNLFRDEI